MSGLELVAVVACIGAIISAYHDGAELVSQIKAKRRARRALQNGSLQELTTKELEESLHRGGGVVQSQFDRDARRFGEQFTTGDTIAREALKDVIIHLQGQMIANLKIQWQQETIQDFSSLQEVSDNSQDRVVMVLLQLQQRIIMKGPFEIMKPPPLFWDSNAAASHQDPYMAHHITDAPHTNAATQPQRYLHDSPGPRYYNGRLLSPQTSANGQVSPPSIQNESQFASRTTNSEINADEKPKGLMKSSFFGRRRKDPVAPAVPAEQVARSFPEAQVVSQHLIPAIHENLNPNNHNTQNVAHPSTQRMSTATSASAGSIHSGVESISTAGGSPNLEPDQPEYNPWATPENSTTISYTNHDARSITSTTPSHNSQESRSVASSNKRTVVPSTVTVITAKKASISVKDLLPSEENKFSGFCKGAWRLQIGDRKKAMEDRQRPGRGGSTFNSHSYWKCKGCNFEGRLIQIDKKTKVSDKTIISTDGIQFRWEFLFKCHIETKDNSPNPLKSTFGCIFCCAEGRSTPTFGGAQSFMDHLQEHRVRLPEGEVLYRMNCITGRKAAQAEDFDIALERREGLGSDFIPVTLMG
ncbi:MAG: hypothetical protein L6R37_001029 [Teloschistes peruensis]|nr:MAG: hypothetical protein L6R37_001029 [Teloschistes peruensis]